jgi:hypothetical protein
MEKRHGGELGDGTQLIRKLFVCDRRFDQRAAVVRRCDERSNSSRERTWDNGHLGAIQQRALGGCAQRHLAMPRWRAQRFHQELEPRSGLRAFAREGACAICDRQHHRSS